MGPFKTIVLGLGFLSTSTLLAVGCGEDEPAAAPAQGGAAGAAGRGGSAGSASGGRSGGAGEGASGGEAGDIGASGSGGTGGGSGGAGGSAGKSATGGSAGNGANGGSGASGGSGGDAGGESDAGEGGSGGGEPVNPPDPRCAAASATVLQGSGDPSDPYLLCVPEHLALIGTNAYPLAAAYALGTDLDLVGLTPPLVTIGVGVAAFTGEFDGKNRQIQGLSVTLFEYIETGAEVRDLHFSGTTDVTGMTFSQGMLTRNNRGTIRGVHGEGTLAASDHAGVIAGTNEGLIEECSARGTITTGGSHVGGLVGVNVGTVRRSFSTVSVTAGQRVGGLVGRQTAPGVIEESYSLGPVTGTRWTGGLVGTIFGGSITNSYARPQSVSAEEAGGLVGNVAGDGVTITNSYASAGSLTGTGAEGLVGLVELGTPTITSSYFNDSASGTLGTAASSAEMQTQATFVGWDFAAIWQFDAAISTFPSLRFQSAP